MSAPGEVGAAMKLALTQAGYTYDGDLVYARGPYHITNYQPCGFPRYRAPAFNASCPSINGSQVDTVTTY